MSIGLQRAAKRSLMRTIQSARAVQGRERSPWVRRFYALLAPVYDFTLLNMPGYRTSARELIDWLKVAMCACCSWTCRPWAFARPVSTRCSSI